MIVELPESRDLPSGRQERMRAGLLAAIDTPRRSGRHRRVVRFAAAAVVAAGVTAGAVAVVPAFLPGRDNGPAAALAYAGGAIAPEIQRAADQCIEDNRVHTDLEPALPDDLRLANLVSRNGNVAVVFTTEGGALYCFNEPGNGSRSMTRRVVSNWMPGAIEIGGATSMEAHGTSDYFATAGRVSSRVARVVLDHGNGRQTAANVADGTFVVIADGDVEVDETVLVAYDSAGTEIARSQGWSRRGLSEQSADCYVDPTGAVVWGSTPGTVCRDAEAWR
ncbi:hypothetical protein [Virgisporangium aurantiacum]|uniref:Uncharacterized protein n=1 Tax=Virgisporangium aurantiacum TaxID=175570 RepID=A0A8J3Z8B0_9ACTN|nr:hypothetical protein [Virgisporangium aurantiacum]GIJ56795.1 hypothetical protein Vau01_043110 [Virgisporangium aurantiacum]